MFGSLQCTMTLGRRKRELGQRPLIVVCLVKLKADSVGEMEETRVHRSHILKYRACGLSITVITTISL